MNATKPGVSAPVKEYTATAAKRAMKAGKVLRMTGGYVCYWSTDLKKFIKQERAGIKNSELFSFNGLYEELPL